VKNEYENGIIDHFFLKEKKLDLQKIENYVATFPY
jgi:hypothetical protein